jgi:sigma-B regulation protein RsbU (phosphoserine phosphatase)
MNSRSFANRLTWRILGIVSVIFIISFIVVGLTMQYLSAHEVADAAPWKQILNLIIVGIIGLVVLFFLCRRMIRRMSRPITELSVSAMNMAKGNFKAKLPKIDSKDEMRLLRDSFLYLENSITD